MHAKESVSFSGTFKYISIYSVLESLESDELMQVLASLVTQSFLLTSCLFTFNFIAFINLCVVCMCVGQRTTFGSSLFPTHRFQESHVSV